MRGIPGQRWAACVVLVLGVVAGCNKSAQRSAQREPQVPLSTQKFESVKEPAITADTRFAAGQLAESRRDWSAALTQYEAALKIDPKHLQALSRAGVAQTMLRQHDKAIATQQRYLKATNGSPEAWNNLAQAFEFAGKPFDAEQAYRSGVEQHPDSVILRTNFGLMLVRYERVDEGREQMAAVLTPAEVHYNVGSVLELKGDRPAAREEYARALRLDPEFIDARKRLAALGD